MQSTFIDCQMITGAGLQHIIRKALPALQKISFHITPQFGMAAHVSLNSLNALHFGGNLQCIDLRGAFGLTSDRVTQFCNTMHRKQLKGKVQPCVTLLLPSPRLEKPEAVFETRDTILLPNLYKLPTSPLDNKLMIEKQ